MIEELNEERAAWLSSALRPKTTHLARLLSAQPSWFSFPPAINAGIALLAFPGRLFLPPQLPSEETPDQARKGDPRPPGATGRTHTRTSSGWRGSGLSPPVAPPSGRSPSRRRPPPPWRPGDSRARRPGRRRSRSGRFRRGPTPPRNPLGGL